MSPVRHSHRYWTTDRIMWLLISLAAIVAIIWLVKYLNNALLPFFAACFVAYLLQPVVEFNRRLIRSKGRVLASFLTLIDVTVAIGLVVYLFLPSVVAGLGNLGDIVRNVSSGQLPVPESCRGVISFIDRHLDPGYIASVIDGARIETLLNKGSSLLEESIDVVIKVLSWLLTLIYIIFIMIDYPQICRGFKLVIPHKYRGRMMPVVRDVAEKMNSYFRGQGLVASCAAVLYCAGFSIVDLPLAIPMGLLVGVLYMIPYFQYVTLIPVAAICFVYSLGGEAEFLPELGKCVLVYVVSQSVCDYIVTPHVMGREMGMNPAIILLSLSVWGSLLGIIGMIIALPITSLLMTYYERYISEPTGKLPMNKDKTETDDT